MQRSPERGMHSNMERIKVNLERPRKDAYEILIGEKIINRGEVMTKVKEQVDRFVIITDSWRIGAREGCRDGAAR